MPDIVWVTTTLPDATVGVAYQAGLAETGSASAVTALVMKAASGALPDGIICNQTDFVRLTGTPTTPGLYTFKLQMTDSSSTVDSGTFTLRVRNAADAVGKDVQFSDLPVLAQQSSTWPA